MTATGTSAGGQTSTAAVSATVTGHDCTISLTKVADASACQGATASYELVVTNHSDRFTWTGTLTDAALAFTQAVTLAPGASAKFTVEGPVTTSVSNTADSGGCLR